MIYYFSQDELIRLQALKIQVYSQYSAEDAEILDRIISKAISDKFISRDDASELIKILPKIVPSSDENILDDVDESNDIFLDRTKEEKERYRYEVEKLRLMLSKWLFLNSAVYQKTTDRLKINRHKKTGKKSFTKHKSSF